MTPSAHPPACPHMPAHPPAVRCPRRPPAVRRPRMRTRPPWQTFGKKVVKFPRKQAIFLKVFRRPRRQPSLFF